MLEDVKIEGVRPDIPFDDYLRMRAISSSMLKHSKRSLAYARWRMENPTPSTQAMAVGTALHTAVLEPKTWESRVGVLPEHYDGRKKEYKGLLAQMKGQYKVVLKHAEAEAVQAMARSVWKNEGARILLEANGSIESTVTVFDPITNAMCKGRLDKHCYDAGVILDVKKTAKRSIGECVRQAYDLDYFHQLAFYRMMVRWLVEKGVIACAPPEMCAILFVLEDPPHENILWPIPRDVINVEEDRLRNLINVVSESLETDYWPGFPEIGEPVVPHWIAKKYGIVL